VASVGNDALFQWWLGVVARRGVSASRRLIFSSAGIGGWRRLAAVAAANKRESGENERRVYYDAVVGWMKQCVVSGNDVVSVLTFPPGNNEQTVSRRN